MVYLNNGTLSSCVKKKGDSLHVMTELSSRYIVRWRGGAEQGEKERGSGWLRTEVTERDLLTFESHEYFRKINKIKTTVKYQMQRSYTVTSIFFHSAGQCATD